MATSPSRVRDDCVVELVGLELTTKVLWMVRVRPTPLVGHLPRPPGALLFCLPVSQSRISPVVGDCVVELVGLEPTTKVLWNMVGVRPTTLVGHLSGLPGALMFCLIFLAF